MSDGCQRFTLVYSRRDLLRMSAAGFGSLALASLFQEQARADDPLAPRRPQFSARAKRVIFLFMHGGPSQVDTFDYKPLLERDHGKPLPFSKPRVFSSSTGNLLKSPWKFRQHGESGAWVSALFPHVAGCVDDLCIINGMHGSNSRHGGALLATGAVGAILATVPFVNFIAPVLVTAAMVHRFEAWRREGR